MRAINIWAWQEGLPNIAGFQRSPICSDAGLEEIRTPIWSWMRNPIWHLALSFSDLADLGNKLHHLQLPENIPGNSRTLQRGELQHLVIDCHGTDGAFFPSQVRRNLAVNIDTIPRYREAMRQIGLMTASSSHNAQAINPSHQLPHAPTEHGPSTITIMACNTGRGDIGSRFLRRLSYEWPNRSVVAFSSTIVFPRLDRFRQDTGRSCVPPLALDPQRELHGEEAGEWVSSYRHLPPASLPIANATLRSAKIAINGRITRTPDNEQHHR